MIICINVDNSNITFGVFDLGSLHSKFSLCTNADLSADEYICSITNVLSAKGVKVEEIDGAIIASVVPSLTSKMVSVSKSLFGVDPLIVGAGIKTSLDIKVDNPGEVGADIVCGAVGAIATYGSPCIVYNFVSATTIAVISDKIRLTDVFITPGLSISAQALVDNAAAIPNTPISVPKSLSGKNTVNSINCGMMYSQASIVDGFAKRIAKRDNIEYKLVATGEMAKDIVLLCDSKVTIDENLILKGLSYIYDKNAK